MLVNLTPNWKEIERRIAIAKEHNFVHIPQCDEKLMQHGTGIYQSNIPFNFGYNEFLEFNIDDGIYNIPFDLNFDTFKPTYHKVQYGVSDSIEQIKEYYKEEIEDLNKKYVISFTPVFQNKDNKGKRNGWRWSKWGEYIGKLNSECEYLDDEDFGEDFKYVITFHLIEIK